MYIYKYVPKFQKHILFTLTLAMVIITNQLLKLVVIIVFDFQVISSNDYLFNKIYYFASMVIKQIREVVVSLLPNRSNLVMY